MSKTAIRVEGLSKKYRLGELGTGTLSHDLNRWWAKARGKADPYLKVDQAEKTQRGEFWALDNIDLKVEKGGVLGLIGNNGAGKSTLLKIMSRITKPTSGRILLNGKVSSLLEVGTGFHPEMTGRENVFLNGAIMGMRRWEIKQKFEEIVEFAGVSQHIDTPVKRYSSGMYVRLAFSVAAHLNSDILIVDEVLAVGDTEFQKKCLGKMGDVSKAQGRTIIFVSHNIAAISKLCNNAVLLDKGKLIKTGNTHEVISYYQDQHLAREHGLPLSERKNRNGSGIVTLTKFDYSLDPNLSFTLSYKSEYSRFKGRLYISVYDRLGNTVIFLDSHVQPEIPSEFPGNGDFKIHLSESVRLCSGHYTVNVAILMNEEWVDHIEGALHLKVPDTDFYGSGRSLYHKPIIHILQRWQLQENLQELIYSTI